MRRLLLPDAAAAAIPSALGSTSTGPLQALAATGLQWLRPCADQGAPCPPNTSHITAGAASSQALRHSSSSAAQGPAAATAAAPRPAATSTDAAAPSGASTSTPSELARQWAMYKALQHPRQRHKPAKYNPWVYTRHLVRPHNIKRRMGFLMETLEQEQVRASMSDLGEGLRPLCL